MPIYKNEKDINKIIEEAQKLGKEIGANAYYEYKWNETVAKEFINMIGNIIKENARKEYDILSDDID